MIIIWFVVKRRRLVCFGSILGEELLDEIAERSGEVWAHFLHAPRVLSDMFHGHLHRVGTGEELFAGEEFEEDYAEAVEITPCVRSRS